MPRINKVCENLFHITVHFHYDLFKNLHTFIGNKTFRNERDVYFMDFIDSRPHNFFFL